MKSSGENTALMRISKIIILNLCSVGTVQMFRLIIIKFKKFINIIGGHLYKVFVMLYIFSSV